MATIHLSSGLSAHAGGLEAIVIEAPRVRELMLELVARYPTLGGDLLSQMAVAIDGDIYHDADYLPLRSDSDVYLVPRITGG